MLDSVHPDETMVFHGKVDQVYQDELNCGCVELSLWLTVGENVTRRCQARVALPIDADDNPWTRGSEAWVPDCNTA